MAKTYLLETRKLRNKQKSAGLQKCWGREQKDIFMPVLRTGSAAVFCVILIRVFVSKGEDDYMKPSEEIVRLFEKDRFATENGAVIEEVDEGYARCGLKIEDRHRNAMGAVMGGVYFTLADFALAVAGNWKEMGHVSLNSEITYLSAARGKYLTAEAVCVKQGRTTGYYRIDVKDELGNLAAAVTATTFRLGK